MNNDWIGIDEYLPEIDDVYLVAWLPNCCLNRKKCFMEIAEFITDGEGGGDWIMDDVMKRYPEGITLFAWMSLPDMYERGDKESDAE